MSSYGLVAAGWCFWLLNAFRRCGAKVHNHDRWGILEPKPSHSTLCKRHHVILKKKEKKKICWGVLAKAGPEGGGGRYLTKAKPHKKDQDTLKALTLDLKICNEKGGYLIREIIRAEFMRHLETKICQSHGAADLPIRHRHYIPRAGFTAVLVSIMAWKSQIPQRKIKEPCSLRGGKNPQLRHRPSFSIEVRVGAWTHLFP